MPRYLLEACPQNHDHYALNSDSRTNTVPNVMRTEELRNGTQFQLGTSKGQFNGMEEGTRERKLMVLQQQPSHELFKLSVAILKVQVRGMMIWSIAHLYLPRSALSQVDLRTHVNGSMSGFDMWLMKLGHAYWLVWHIDSVL